MLSNINVKMKKYIDNLVFKGLLLILDDAFLQIESNIPIDNLYDCKVIIWSVYIKCYAYTNNVEKLTMCCLGN